MAYTVRYANFDLVSGLNDGTSEANAWQTLAAMNAGMGAGSTLVYIKRQAARMSWGSAQTLGVAGTAVAPNRIVGYETTPGDGGMWALGSDSFARNIGINAHTMIVNIDFDGAGGGLLRSQGQGLNDNVVAERCRFYAQGELRYSDAYGCRFEFATAAARLAGSSTDSTPRYAGNLFVSAGAADLIRADVFAGGSLIAGNVFAGNGAGRAIYLDRNGEGPQFILGNIFHNFGGEAVLYQLDSAGSRRNSIIQGNLFSTIGGYGVRKPATISGQFRLRNNFYHACTSGLTDYPEELVAGSVALSADPFVAAAGGDFAINEAAGGGALIRAAAFLTDPTGGASTTFRPLGSFLASSAGGGSPITIAHFG